MNLNIGIVGAGAISEIGYIPAIKQTRGILLRGLVDTNEKRLKYLRDKFNLQYYTVNLEKIIDKIDALIIATPPHTHQAIAKKAFGAGLNVLCEKPMANNSKECQKIIDFSKKAKKILAIGHAYRLLPDRQSLHSLLRNKIKTIKEINIEQGAKASWPTKTGYSFRKGLVPGGVLFNEGLHSLDFIYWLLGYPKKIEYFDDSIGGLESNCQIRLVYNNSIRSKLRFSRTCSLSNTIKVILKNNIIQTSTNYADFSIVSLLQSQLQNFKKAIEGKENQMVSGDEASNIIKIIESCYCIKKRRQLPKRAPIPGEVW